MIYAKVCLLLLISLSPLLAASCAVVEPLVVMHPVDWVIISAITHRPLFGLQGILFGSDYCSACLAIATSVIPTLLCSAGNPFDLTTI